MIPTSGKTQSESIEKINQMCFKRFVYYFVFDYIIKINVKLLKTFQECK